MFEIQTKKTPWGTEWYGDLERGTLAKGIAQGMVPKVFETREDAAAIVVELHGALDKIWHRIRCEEARAAAERDGKEYREPDRISVAPSDIYKIVEAKPEAVALAQIGGGW